MQTNSVSVYLFVHPNAKPSCTEEGRMDLLGDIGTADQLTSSKLLVLVPERRIPLSTTNALMIEKTIRSSCRECGFATKGEGAQCQSQGVDGGEPVIVGRGGDVPKGKRSAHLFQNGTGSSKLHRPNGSGPNTRRIHSIWGWGESRNDRGGRFDSNVGNAQPQCHRNRRQSTDLFVPFA